MSVQNLGLWPQRVTDDTPGQQAGLRIGVKALAEGSKEAAAQMVRGEASERQKRFTPGRQRGAERGKGEGLGPELQANLEGDQSRRLGLAGAQQRVRGGSPTSAPFRFAEMDPMLSRVSSEIFSPSAA